MEKLDKKTYRGIVKFTLESMLNLSKTDKNYNLAADTIYYYDFRNIAFLVYICYNASRQWNKYLHIQRKPQRVAFSGVFYSVKWFNLLGWLPYSSPSSHLQI